MQFIGSVQFSSVRESVLDRPNASSATIVSKLIIEIIDSVANIQAERNSNNLPLSENLLPVLPHELIKLSIRRFTTIVVEHLDQFWGEQTIDTLERQHQYLGNVIPYYSQRSTIEMAIHH